MRLIPTDYDEGIILTGALRVAHGQVPHRDFYAIYGPANFYSLALLYKIFGPSLLVERLLDIVFRSFVVTLTFAVTARYTSRKIAAFTSLTIFLWLVGFHPWTPGSAIFPASLFCLLGASTLLPAFWTELKQGRSFLVGISAGLSAMYRYETGLALIALFVLILFSARYLGTRQDSSRSSWASILFCVLGFLCIVLPPSFLYLAHAPLQPFLHDAFIYPGKYYPRTRRLPFPSITLRSFENIGAYLPIAVIAIAARVLVARYRQSPPQRLANVPQNAILLTFGALTAVLYVKAFVRLGPPQAYLALVTMSVVLAVLLHESAHLSRNTRLAVRCVAALAFVSAAFSTLHPLHTALMERSSLPDVTLSRLRGTISPVRSGWCHTASATTRGMCFLLDDDRIRIDEYLLSHAKPTDTLFSGLPSHDRTFANDNFIYFATQLMPATHWSHFDPDLESRADIQREMVSEFTHAPPRFVVLNGEYERLPLEPNDSARSSGVHLLDEYIRSHYFEVERAGFIHLLERR